MDVFAHTLWAAAAAKGANHKLARKLRTGWLAFFGVFPDLFAFGPTLAIHWWSRLTDPAQAALAGGDRRFAQMTLAWDLYQISHSLIIFTLVFCLVWLIAGRPVRELLGWPLHILIDIPTHTFRFFPTPFLWPVSSFKVSGISWGNRWFMLANYGSLLIVYLLLWRAGRRKAATSSGAISPSRQRPAEDPFRPPAE